MIMATAMASRNCLSVSQWNLPTTPPYKNGTIARPLPNTKAPAFRKNRKRLPTVVAIAGDVAMLEKEVPPTLKALRSHGLDVVAIHNHMIGMQPSVIFLHYWGRGPAEKLAAGFKAALDQLGKAGQ